MKTIQYSTGVSGLLFGLILFSPGSFSQDTPTSAAESEINTPGIGLAREFIPPRDPQAGPRLIDLTASYNAGLVGTWHTDISISPESLRSLPNDLSELPKGVQTLAGIQFEIRGIIQLLGKTMEREGGKYPARVEGIPIGQKMNRFHVFHGTGWGVPPDTVIGSYILHYADGTKKEFQIVYGQHVLDWWRINGGQIASNNSAIAWTGANPLAKEFVRLQGQSGLDQIKSALLSWVGLPADSWASQEAIDIVKNPLRLFKTTWDNPNPDTRVDSLDFVSSMTDSAPFLVALTIEP
ncbi:MAG: hypothetical protein ACE15F_24030 [bacterium]